MTVYISGDTVDKMMKSGSSAVIASSKKSNETKDPGKVNKLDGRVNRKQRSTDAFQEIQFEACSSSRSRSPSVRTDNSIFPSRPPSTSTEMSPRLPPSLTNRLDNKTPFLNLAMVGPVDSGKSSLAGRLLYDCGAVDEAVLARSSNDAIVVSNAYPVILEHWKVELLRRMTKIRQK